MFFFAYCLCHSQENFTHKYEDRVIVGGNQVDVVDRPSQVHPERKPSRFLSVRIINNFKGMNIFTSLLTISICFLFCQSYINSATCMQKNYSLSFSLNFNTSINLKGHMFYMLFHSCHNISKFYSYMNENYLGLVQQSQISSRVRALHNKLRYS